MRLSVREKTGRASKKSVQTSLASTLVCRHGHNACVIIGVDIAVVIKGGRLSSKGSCT